MTPEERADVHILNGCPNEIHIHGPGGCFECTALMIHEAENDALERAARIVYSPDEDDYPMPDAAARKIRALKTEPKEETP